MRYDSYHPDLDFPMGLAILNDDIATVQQLLGENPFLAESDFALEFETLTPLQLACRWGRVEIAKALIEHGADINAVDECAYAPLDYAYLHGNQ